MQQAKDIGYSARYVFVEVPSQETQRRQLLVSGIISEDEVQELLSNMAAEIKHSKTEGFSDKIIVNDDLETACKILEAFIYGSEDQDLAANWEPRLTDPDVSIRDASPAGGGLENPRSNGVDATADH